MRRSGRAAWSAGYYEVNDRGTGNHRGRMVNVYFQDAWRIKQRLTLTLGLRLENDTPSLARLRRRIRVRLRDKIAPRLG